ncbi:MAG: acetate--CoA ligase family protein [Acidimicrobiia bacterium]
MLDLRTARALLAPRSIALVGASDDENRPTGRPLRYLRRDGWAGALYPVNARREQVLGERAWPALDALPEVPDHVFVLLGSDAAVEVVEQCGRLGVPIATVLAGGFAEAGDAGVGRTARLRAAAAATGVRILGPNSIGVVDTRSRLTLTANAAFVDADLAPGRTFVASQSGSLIGALATRGRGRHIGFATLVSVGSETDLTLGEVCAASLDDDTIDSYALFLETLANADDLRAFAVEASARGKPVIAYKLGRSDAAADLAVTHTGALAGDDDVARAFLEDCGIARVETFDGFLEGTVLAGHVPPRTKPGVPRVGVVTATGGGAAMVVDQLGIRGIDVPGPSPALLGRVVDAVGFEVESAGIVDLTLRGTGAEPMSAAIEQLRSSGEFDLVVQVVGSSAVSHPEIATQPAIAATRNGTPLAVFAFPEAPDALTRFGAAGVPAFRSPEACGDAIAALLLRRPPRAITASPPLTASPLPELRLPSGTLGEVESYALLDRLGVPRLPSVVLERDEVPPALPFEFPVAVKLAADEVSHKSELGGVVLGVSDAAGVTGAIAAIANRAGAHGITHSRYLVQPMVQGGTEVLLGYRRDPHVGPIVMVAPGGVLAELSDERCIRLAPVDQGTARAMVDELPGLARLLGGYRGRPAADLDDLARVISAFSQLAFVPEVVDAETNPLVVTGDTVVAVDALVKVA